MTARFRGLFVCVLRTRGRMLRALSMHESTPPEPPLSKRAMDRLRPVADQVDAFTRECGRAVVDADGELAKQLLSANGERSRCDAVLQAAWADILAGQSYPWADVAANVALLASLEKIADLATR